MPEPVTSSTLIEVIILCCSRSELKSLVGTDALRTVLDGMQATVFPAPGVLALQPLYELLFDQPGFEHELMVAPFSRLKTWESQLGIRVDMPAALAEMPRAALEFASKRCEVTEAELEAVLHPPAPPPRPASTSIPPAIASTPVPRSGASKPATRARVALSSRAKLAVGAAGLSVIAALVSLYLTTRPEPSNVQVLKPTDISDQIPLAAVRRSGAVIIATVTDSAWIAKPEQERRAQLLAASDKVRAQQATELLLLDAKTAPIGTLVVRSSPVVTFMPAL